MLSDDDDNVRRTRAGALSGGARLPSSSIPVEVDLKNTAGPSRKFFIEKPKALTQLHPKPNASLNEDLSGETKTKHFA